jgi:hypothetical protein
MEVRLPEAPEGKLIRLSEPVSSRGSVDCHQCGLMPEGTVGARSPSQHREEIPLEECGSSVVHYLSRKVIRSVLANSDELLNPQDKGANLYVSDGFRKAG